MLLSIIMPAFNEASCIAPALESLKVLQSRGVEVIVVDGESEDATAAVAARYADKVLKAPQGRALQMNAGARAARGEILFFVHADCIVPQNADVLILRDLEKSSKSWGRFDVKLSGSHAAFRVIERLMNLRSRLTGIATGDQGIFVRRHAFFAVGGFPEIALMEDIALSRRLRRIGQPLCLRERIVTSSRRWEEKGIARTVFLMWALRFGYWLGAPPEAIAKRYHKN